MVLKAVLERATPNSVKQEEGLGMLIFLHMLQFTYFNHNKSYVLNN